MTPLKQHFIKRIEATGPMTLAAYMAECLMHPTHGYYQQQAVFGAEGDFITAPEVSQMFGEMIGLWLADRWIKMGRPKAVNLIELGPGRGTLMADILRATEPVSDFQEAINVHFVETSAQLRAQQASRVPNAQWHERLTDVPEGKTLIIANEFFDALPIHQYEKRDDQWFERLVGSDSDQLGFTLGACGPQFGLISPAMKDSAEGSILECCPAALSITGEIADRLTLNEGAALIIDYGYRKTVPGDTFQALKNHEFSDPFDAPGTADLTAHVAFDQLKQAASERCAVTFGPAMQGMFLMGVGIGARAQVLAANAEPETQTRILSELKRLTATDQMGTLFKVLALQSPALAPPPGF
jgi:NADH dehydrogenase [ubiquinone] 1 alpha subcomplex assembly factor 7